MRIRSIFVFIALSVLAASFCSCSDDSLMGGAAQRKAVKERLAQKQAMMPSDDVWGIFSAEMTSAEREAMEFMYANMSAADIGDYSGDFILENVRYALKAREEMAWGKEIPTEIFRHFVLPSRVNNETLDSFRSTYYNEIKERVAGLSMVEAALEINHWCHEKVTYSSTDGRTLGPMSTIQTATGRCGEESVLTVAAFRTAGIPSRQVYTPLWAHTDSNHAWVEVWVDGKWHFLGACEPAPVLDYAWFNSTASRAILLHTKAFGDYDGEDVIKKTSCYTEVNVTNLYVDTRRSVVTVQDADGKPVEGATVDFKIFNGGGFGNIVSLETGADGKVALTTGLGDLLVWASHEGRFGVARCTSEQTVVTLDHKAGDVFSLDVDMVPPAEGMIPYDVTDEQEAANAIRLQEEDRMRNSYIATFYQAGSEPSRAPREARLIASARGNWKEIKAFIDNNRDTRLEDALSLLESLTQKDVAEQPLAVLQAVLDQTPLVEGLDYQLWKENILPPKMGNEFLVPYKQIIRDAWSGPSAEELRANPQLLVEWTASHISCPDGCNPQDLNMTPLGVWRLRVCDSAARNRFFVALCRTFGIPASMRNGVRYWKDGSWYDVNFEQASSVKVAENVGDLRLEYTADSQKDLRMYLSPSRIEDGVPVRSRRFSMPRRDDKGMTMPLQEGYYMLATGSRMARGNVLAHIDFFNIEKDGCTTLPLVIRSAGAEDVAVLGTIDTEINGKFLPEGAEEESTLIAATGRGYFLLMISGAHDEPTMHVLNEMPGMSAETVNSWGRPFLVLTRNAHDLADLDKSKLSAINGITWGIDTDDTVLDMILSAARSERKTLPVFVIADSFGRVVYFSQGYNTSLGNQINEVISKIR